MTRAAMNPPGFDRRVVVGAEETAGGQRQQAGYGGAAGTAIGKNLGQAVKVSRVHPNSPADMTAA
jgi:hypothetical protein